MSKYGYLIVKPSGEVTLVSSKSAEFTLEELQIGSRCTTIQIVPGRVSNMLLCIDDEGKLLGKPVNKIASILYGQENDFIVGDAIVGTNWNDDPEAEPDIYKMPLDIAKRFQVVIRSLA